MPAFGFLQSQTLTPRSPALLYRLTAAYACAGECGGWLGAQLCSALRTTRRPRASTASANSPARPGSQSGHCATTRSESSFHHPRREGRIGWYSQAHLNRLRVIGQLLDRGHTLGGIGELLSAWEQGYDLADLLGFERAMTAPWSDEVPVPVTVADLRAARGPAHARGTRGSGPPRLHRGRW